MWKECQMKNWKMQVEVFALLEWKISDSRKDKNCSVKLWISRDISEK